MNVCTAWPRFMCPQLAVEYVGGQLIFEELVDTGLVKPRVQRKGLTRYDRCELDNALDRWKGFPE
jgi:hypothetical protein